MSRVRDVGAANRFELEVDGVTAFAAYSRHGDRITFTHTEVPASLAGRGIGSTLVRGALDAARAEGTRVVPACSFVRHFIETHSEYRDLI
jgi:predicted GNAT family acetyltransferase